LYKIQINTLFINSFYIKYKYQKVIFIWKKEVVYSSNYLRIYVSKNMALNILKNAPPQEKRIWINILLVKDKIEHVL